MMLMKNKSCFSLHATFLCTKSVLSSGPSGLGTEGTAMNQVEFRDLKTLLECSVEVSVLTSCSE